MGTLALRGSGTPGGADDEQRVARAAASPFGRPDTLPPIASPSTGTPTAGPNRASSASGSLRPETPGSTPSPDKSGPGSDSGRAPAPGSDARPDDDPDPGTGRGSETGSLAGDTAEARSTMQAWFRGLGNGDTSICYRYATADFVNRSFGSMNRCRRHVAHVEYYNRRDEVRALRTTTVVGGTLENGTVVVRFSDLRWSSGHMTADTTGEQHRLGIVNGDWKIIG
ncbi:hypothetical protein GCM10009780_61750 [Actinomadura alba]